MTTEREMALFQKADGSTVEGAVRCVVTGATIDPCHVLDQVLTKQEGKASPLLEITRRVARTHDRERFPVVLNTGRRSFAAFDFCPFCGASIVTTFPAEAAAPTVPA